MFTAEEIAISCFAAGATRVVLCRKTMLVFFFADGVTTEAKLLMAVLGQPVRQNVFALPLPPLSGKEEETFVMVKPDATKRGLTETVLRRFQPTGLVLVQKRELTMNVDQASEFYACHRGKPFFDRYVAFMTSGPVVCAVLRGINAVSRARELLGHYAEATAKPGTIRKELGIPDERGILSVAHASDSDESADREKSLFF